jgi:hypothetical protein
LSEQVPVSENVAALPGTTAQAIGNCVMNDWFVIAAKRAIRLESATTGRKLRAVHANDHNISTTSILTPKINALLALSLCIYLRRFLEKTKKSRLWLPRK